MSKLRVQTSPLSNKIYVGRINKQGDAWSGEPQEVTSDVLGSIIQYIGVNKTVTVNENGKPKYSIEVKLIG